MNLFRLERGDYEELDVYLLAHETVDEARFRTDCAELMPEAARVLATAPADAEDGPGWIGIDDIVERLVVCLGARGYRLLNLPVVRYWGGSIVEPNDGEGEVLGDALPAVLAHNERVREWLRLR